MIIIIIIINYLKKIDPIDSDLGYATEDNTIHDLYI